MLGNPFPGRLLATNLPTFSGHDICTVVFNVTNLFNHIQTCLVLGALMFDTEFKIVSYLLAPDDLPTQRSASAHDATLTTALELGRKAGMPLPSSDAIRLIGIEAENMTTFSETCTPPVAASIGRAVETVEHLLHEMRNLP